MKIVTILLLLRDDEILLAMKKRGFGMGLWNGVGGKLNPGETIEQAMIRETQEEIGVTPTSYSKVAIHDFFLIDGTFDMQGHAYVCREWAGKPVETEEMAPKWFKISDIPYGEMWQDDIVWLPLILDGKLLQTKFTFDIDLNMTRAELDIVKAL